jgi:hypothetical protein
MANAMGEDLEEIEIKFSNTHQTLYYYNKTTGVVQWDVNAIAADGRQYWLIDRDGARTKYPDIVNTNQEVSVPSFREFQRLSMANAEEPQSSEPTDAQTKEEAAPEGVSTHYDSQFKRSYFYNSKTRKSGWSLADVVDAVAEETKIEATQEKVTAHPARSSKKPAARRRSTYAEARLSYMRAGIEDEEDEEQGNGDVQQEPMSMTMVVSAAQQAAPRASTGMSGMAGVVTAASAAAGADKSPSTEESVWKERLLRKRIEDEVRAEMYGQLASGGLSTNAQGVAMAAQGSALAASLPTIAANWDEREKQERYRQLEMLEATVKGDMRKSALDLRKQLARITPVLTRVLSRWRSCRLEAGWEKWRAFIDTCQIQDAERQAQSVEERVLKEAEELAVAARLRAEEQAVEARDHAEVLAAAARLRAKAEADGARLRVEQMVAERHTKSRERARSRATPGRVGLLEQEEAAANLVQRRWRGLVARRKVGTKRKELLQMKLQYAAALQTKTKGDTQRRREMLQEKKRQLQSKQMEYDSAVKMQAVIRGRKDRKSAGKRRVSFDHVKGMKQQQDRMAQLVAQAEQQAKQSRMQAEQQAKQSRMQAEAEARRIKEAAEAEIRTAKRQAEYEAEVAKQEAAMARSDAQAAMKEISTHRKRLEREAEELERKKKAQEAGTSKLMAAVQVAEEKVCSSGALCALTAVHTTAH